MPDLLSQDEITTAVAGLDDWEYRDGKLRRSWERKGFNGAIQLANVIAYVANEMNHHPDITVHDYNQVTITSVSHDAGGITKNDLELAHRIERAVNV